VDGLKKKLADLIPPEGGISSWPSEEDMSLAAIHSITFRHPRVMETDNSTSNPPRDIHFAEDIIASRKRERSPISGTPPTPTQHSSNDMLLIHSQNNIKELLELTTNNSIKPKVKLASDLQMVLETNRAFSTLNIKNLLAMVDIKSSLVAALPYLQINLANSRPHQATRFEASLHAFSLWANSASTNNLQEKSDWELPLALLAEIIAAVVTLRFGESRGESAKSQILSQVSDCHRSIDNATVFQIHDDIYAAECEAKDADATLQQLTNYVAKKGLTMNAAKTQILCRSAEDIPAHIRHLANSSAVKVGGI
jgi:hypothetical protein